MASACRSQPAAVNPSAPLIAAAVEAILEKTVAAVQAAAEGVLAGSTRDDTFTFITAERMLIGYGQALAACRQTYAMLQGQTSQTIEKRVRVLSSEGVLVTAVSEGTYTDKAGFARGLSGFRNSLRARGHRRQRGHRGLRARGLRAVR